MIAKEYLPPEIPIEQLRPLMNLVSQIEDSPRRSAEAQKLVAQFNELTGNTYEEECFRAFDGSMDLDTFVKGALLHPQKFPGIPDSQLLEILARIRNGEFDEAELNYWINFLGRNLNCHRISDIIFWSEDDLSDSEILARARAHKPSVIILPPPGEA